MGASAWVSPQASKIADYTVQVYKPFVCDMRQWDLQEFAKCTANKRMIMVGDMSMQQMFNSLACLTRPALKSGKQTPWEVRSKQ